MSFAFFNGKHNPTLVTMSRGLTMINSWNRIFDGDRIMDGLYLGSICRNEAAMRKAGVTHVLSMHDPDEVNTAPFRDSFYYQVVLTRDHPSQNIISAFDECFAFIDEGRKNGGVVFVHWF